MQITDEFELSHALHKLFASDDARRELGERARATFQANLGAAKRTAGVIIQALDKLVEKNPGQLPEPKPVATVGRL